MIFLPILRPSSPPDLCLPSDNAEQECGKENGEEQGNCSLGGVFNFLLFILNDFDISLKV